MTVDSDIAELTSSIKQSLDASGGLSVIRAQLRAQVFGAMQISMPQLEQKPTLNPAAKVALGLIEEFLRFNNCNCTLSTAESEVAGWSERLQGGEVATATGLTKGDTPLLMQLISAQLPGLRARLTEKRSVPQAAGRSQVAPTSPPSTQPASAAASDVSPSRMVPPAGARPAALLPAASRDAMRPTSPTSPTSPQATTRPRATSLGALSSLAPLKGASGGGRGAEEEFVQAERLRRERQQREEAAAARRKAEAEAEALQRRREAEQHGQSAPLAVPELGSRRLLLRACASSGHVPPQGTPSRSGWLSVLTGETGPPGAPPLPRVPELAASKAADFPAFDPPGWR